MIYVMSDIHGNHTRFRSVMDQIGLTDEDSLYILGDVIDRGHFGIQILQELMENPNVTCLLYTSPSPRDMRSSRMPSSA